MLQVQPAVDREGCRWVGAAARYLGNLPKDHLIQFVLCPAGSGNLQLATGQSPRVIISDVLPCFGVIGLDIQTRTPGRLPKSTKFQTRVL